MSTLRDMIRAHGLRQDLAAFIEATLENRFRPPPLSIADLLLHGAKQQLIASRVPSSRRSRRQLCTPGSHAPVVHIGFLSSI